MFEEDPNVNKLSPNKETLPVDRGRSEFFSCRLSLQVTPEKSSRDTKEMFYLFAESGAYLNIVN